MIQEIEGETIGVTFQRACRSPEWRASLVVYEKYKRKMNLQFEDLLKLREYIVSFSEDRKRQGKKVSNDFLIQECSAEVKRWTKI
jgi:hypothetical protein